MVGDGEKPDDGAVPRGIWAVTVGAGAPEYLTEQGLTERVPGIVELRDLERRVAGAEFVDLATREPDLLDRLRSTFAEVLVVEAALRRSRLRDVAAALTIEVADVGLLRVSTPWTGPLVNEWDGDLEELELWATTEALRARDEIVEARSQDGPQAWPVDDPAELRPLTDVDPDLSEALIQRFVETVGAAVSLPMDQRHRLAGEAKLLVADDEARIELPLDRFKMACSWNGSRAELDELIDRAAHDVAERLGPEARRGGRRAPEIFG